MLFDIFNKNYSIYIFTSKSYSSIEKYVSQIQKFFKIDKIFTKDEMDE